MHSIKELEKKWKDYKLRKIVKNSRRLLGIPVGVALAYGAYLYAPTLVPLISKTIEKKEPLFIVEKEIPKISEQNLSIATLIEIPVKEEIEKYEVALEPVIPIITGQGTVHRRYKRVHKVKHAKSSSYLSKKELAVLNHSSFEPDSRKIKKIHLSSSSKGYIPTMKAKFKRSHKPREALLLAKAFYNLSKFKEAEHWALTANKLNSNLDESWFLFAKSKAKLGRKKEAIKILLSYYKKSHSSKAKALIYDIKRERI